MSFCGLDHPFPTGSCTSPRIPISPQRLKGRNALADERSGARLLARVLLSSNLDR